jgi:hypothetical protein
VIFSVHAQAGACRVAKDRGPEREGRADDGSACCKRGIGRGCSPAATAGRQRKSPGEKNGRGGSPARKAAIQGAHDSPSLSSIRIYRSNWVQRYDHFSPCFSVRKRQTRFSLVHSTFYKNSTASSSIHMKRSEPPSTHCSAGIGAHRLARHHIGAAIQRVPSATSDA